MTAPKPRPHTATRVPHGPPAARCCRRRRSTRTRRRCYPPPPTADRRSSATPDSHRGREEEARHAPATTTTTLLGLSLSRASDKSRSLFVPFDRSIRQSVAPRLHHARLAWRLRSASTSSATCRFHDATARQRRERRPQSSVRVRSFAHSAQRPRPPWRLYDCSL